MFYALRKDCYFRKYDDIGYIFRPAAVSEEVVDEIGAIFLEELDYEPRNINDIAEKIYDKLEGIDKQTLLTDVEQFYNHFVDGGFLDVGDKLEGFVSSGFEYETLKGKISSGKNDELGSTMSSYDFLVKHSMNKPFLDTFHIELLSECNERCVHCYIPHENKNKVIDSDLFYDVLSQCKDMGVLTIIFSGGEPMLHPNFCDFLKKAKDLDFNVTVLSNLTLLDEKIVDALKYRHPTGVNVSLYSMIPEVHDSITTLKGSQEKTKNNILKLIRNNIPVQINCPVMKMNKDSFQDVIKWGEGLKCAVVIDYLIMARSNRTTDNLNHRLCQEDLEDVVEKIVVNDKVFKTNYKNFKPQKKSGEGDGEERVCGVGMTTLCMVTNGDVYPCAGWQKFICGNLKVESLRNIWENSKVVRYLRQLRFKDFARCVGCEDKDYCYMCMARNSNEDLNGDIFNIPQITCDAAHIQHRVMDEYRNKLAKN